jgi:uncharacterized Zn-binding protein involved in type VI secretion
MPKACRTTDTVSVHECGVVPTADSATADVFIESLAAHRVTDTNSSHPAVPAPSCAEHVTTLSSGSPDVFVNGLALARIGDGYGCGITLTSGASTVFAN